jgi:hypothetical protein
MAHAPDSQRAPFGLWTGRLVLVVGTTFLAGLVLMVARFPDPPDGPTPAETRLAVYVLFAALVAGMAAIPLAVGLVERRQGRVVAFRWRLVLAGGAVAAVAALRVGVWTWAYPPHNLTECFPSVCDHGRLNRPLGLARLNDGLMACALLLGLTVLAAAWLRIRSEPTLRPEKLGSDPVFSRGGVEQRDGAVPAGAQDVEE